MAVVDFVQTTLDCTKLAPECLVIELSEYAFLDESKTVYSVVSALRDLGVKIAIDNFGVGYSSLFCLRSLPVDLIKLDRCFAQSLDSSSRARGLIRGVLTLAKEIQVSTIVEGVETESQRQILTELGVRNMQGYLFAKPCSATVFKTWLSEFSKSA